MTVKTAAEALNKMSAVCMCTLAYRKPVSLCSNIYALKKMATMPQMTHFIMLLLLQHDKKTTLSAMPLDMEDAIDSWQAGNLPDDAILGDTSMSGREDRVETR
jgi:hypothetical protein